MARQVHLRGGGKIIAVKNVGHDVRGTASGLEGVNGIGKGIFYLLQNFNDYFTRKWGKQE